MILFFYLFRSYFKYVTGFMALTAFMFVLFDFIHKSTKYLTRYQPETKHLVSFYFYQLPNLCIQALPIASLLGSIITMVLLSRTNEVTAMRAAGMGPLRIGAPIAAGGGLLCFFAFLMGEFVLPHSSKKVHYIQDVLIEKRDDVGGYGGSRWVRDGKILVNFKGFEKKTKTLNDVRVIHTGKSFRPKRTMEAHSATYRASSKDWVLNNVKVLYFWPNGTLSYTEERPSHPIKIPIEPDKLKKEQRLPNEMSARELKEMIRLGEASGSDVLHLKVALEIKFAFYFSSFVVSLIGLKFGYRSERSNLSALSILLAVGLGFSYWPILRFGEPLGSAGTLPPFLAAWLANIIIFSISAYSLWKTRKA